MSNVTQANLTNMDDISEMEKKIGDVMALELDIEQTLCEDDLEKEEIEKDISFIALNSTLDSKKLSHDAEVQIGDDWGTMANGGSSHDSSTDWGSFAKGGSSSVSSTYDSSTSTSTSSSSHTSESWSSSSSKVNNGSWTTETETITTTWTMIANEQYPCTFVKREAGQFLYSCYFQEEGSGNIKAMIMPSGTRRNKLWEQVYEFELKIDRNEP